QPMPLIVDNAGGDFTGRISGNLLSCSVSAIAGGPFVEASQRLADRILDCKRSGRLRRGARWLVARAGTICLGRQTVLPAGNNGPAQTTVGLCNPPEPRPATASPWENRRDFLKSTRRARRTRAKIVWELPRLGFGGVVMDHVALAAYRQVVDLVQQGRT